MQAGFIYVLVNSSMPGLVKVGKTTRNPIDRAAELSGVTGVATPFMLAFSEEFPDCHQAEQEIHRELTKKGFREASNREFFRASPQIVIKAVISVHEALTKDLVESGCSPINLLNEGLSQSDNPWSQPWSDLFIEGLNHLFGMNDYLEDRDRGVSLLKDAARLGSTKALIHLGNQYRRDNNSTLALQAFGEATERGDYYGFSDMSQVYAHLEHKENFRKCISKFFQSRETGYRSTFESKNAYNGALFKYICNSRKLGIPISYEDECRHASAELLEYFNSLEEAPKWDGRPLMMAAIKDARAYLSTIGI